MGLRWTEDDLKDYQARQKRQALPCVPPVPSGVSVADMDRSKRNKYGNRRVELDGIRFDSQKEARYYEELMLRYRAGDLKLVLLQVPFILPGPVKYYADFLTIDNDGRFEVIDVKSEATRKNRVYINKKKQMKAVWGIEIKEV
jgi:hypothetical protein